MSIKIIIKQIAILPPEPPSNLEEPIESISSINIIEGACSLIDKNKNKNGYTSTCII